MKFHGGGHHWLWPYVWITSVTLIMHNLEWCMHRLTLCSNMMKNLHLIHKFLCAFCRSVLYTAECGCVGYVADQCVPITRPSLTKKGNIGCIFKRMHGSANQNIFGACHLSAFEHRFSDFVWSEGQSLILFPLKSFLCAACATTVAMWK